VTFRSIPGVLLCRILLTRGYLRRDERTLKIMGMDPAIYGDKPLTEFEKEFELTKSLQLNAFRVFCSFDFYKVLNELQGLLKSSGLGLIPVIFPQFEHERQVKLWQMTIAELKFWVDQWVPKLGDTVLFWEVFNELYDDADPQKVKELMEYTRSKTKKPVTISFHQDRDSVFDQYINLCDITSRHWYKWATMNPYSDFQNRLKDMASIGKPFILSEFGFWAPQPKEGCQHSYTANLLHIMKEQENPNFLGYIAHCIKDSPYDSWGYFTRDNKPKLATHLFP